MNDPTPVESYLAHPSQVLAAARMINESVERITEAIAAIADAFDLDDDGRPDPDPIVAVRERRERLQAARERGMPHRQAQQNRSVYASRKQRGKHR